MKKLILLLLLIFVLSTQFYASLRFVNKSNSNVNVGTTNLFGNQGTLMFWLRPTTLDTGTESIIDHSATDFSHYAGLGFDTTGGSLNFYKRRGSFTGIQIKTTAFLTTNQWYFVAVVWDINAADSAQKIYYGTPSTSLTEASYTSQTAGTGTPTTPAGGLVCYIGNSQSLDNSFDGDLYEMAIYNTALNQAQINAAKGWMHNEPGVQRLWFFGNSSSILTDYSGNVGRLLRWRGDLFQDQAKIIQLHAVDTQLACDSFGSRGFACS